MSEIETIPKKKKKKLAASNKTKKSPGKKSAQKLILKKLKIPDDIAEIVIELKNEFKVQNKWFYIFAAIGAVGLIIYNETKKTEKKQPTVIDIEQGEVKLDITGEKENV